MKAIHKEIIWAVALAASVIGLFAIMPAEAHHTIIIENNIDTHTHTLDEVTLTDGLSDSEVAALLTVAASAGAHQFDFSTTDWQGSITGAWYDDEDAVSFGVAKRFSEDFLPNVLLHGNYTQNGSDDLWVIGGTFRF